MMSTLRKVESLIAPPEPVPHKGSFVFRYANKDIHEALVQKFVRYISGLNAVAILLDAGYVQEVGVLFRTLDEIQEDIFFLASAETNGARTDRHTQYLKSFYAEAVFSCPEGSLRIPKPDLPPRKKVRAHTVNVLGQGINGSQALDAGESVSAAYSGYVHAASENVMDMYGGNPPHFHVEGMRGTPLISTFERAAEHYVYRGRMTAGAVAKAFGDRLLVEAIYEFLAMYEAANGHAKEPAPNPFTSPHVKR